MGWDCLFILWRVELIGEKNIPTLLSYRNTEMVQAVGHFLVEGIKGPFNHT